MRKLPSTPMDYRTQPPAQTPSSEAPLQQEFRRPNYDCEIPASEPQIQVPLSPKMPSLVQPKKYDISDSNVGLIGSDIDHQVKHNSAETEPAWSSGGVGEEAGVYVWRIEDFKVVVWPGDQFGQFFDGDSYIVLHSYKVGKDDDKLCHEIYFWLGNDTTQDEAGTAAYKTVELDEFLKGSAIQHRELQQQPSDEFVALFPRITVRSGGVRSGFTHVDRNAGKKEVTTLLRIFQHSSTSGRSPTVVYEVEPTWKSLSEDDVFVLDKGDKIWVWQGKNCRPMEKAKAAEVVSELTIAKHIDVKVLAQADSRSHIVVDLLGGKDVAHDTLRAPNPMQSAIAANTRPRRLLRLSDASGQLSFDIVKESQPILRSDFDTNDVFLLDAGRTIWVWRGLGASAAERAMWIKVAQSYVNALEGKGALTPFAAVVEGSESPSFFQAIGF